jgi:hypothetical protein
MRKIVLCAQYWAGDKEAMMRNLRRISDNEPSFREDTEILLCARFDCEHDPVTIEHISKKFKVDTFTSPRRGTGWPHGCNELAFAVLNESAVRYIKGDWQNVKAIFIFESDCIPIAKDWLDVVHSEWDEAESQGKLVSGCWSPYHGDGFGHINGNLLAHPYLATLHRLIGCDPTRGWDDWLSSQVHQVWHKAGFIKNLYKATNVADCDFASDWIPGKRAVLIHGVKDMSAENYADRMLFANSEQKNTDTEV